jgi:hypothetical protein
MFTSLGCSRTGSSRVHSATAHCFERITLNERKNQNKQAGTRLQRGEITAMKLRIGSALLSMIFLLPVAAMARDHDSRKVNIGENVVVAGHQLTPGNYKLEWHANGPRVEVNFVQDGKVVATAPARLKTGDSQVTQDDIVTRKTANKDRLMEIDFGKQKEALLFARQTQS